MRVTKSIAGAVDGHSSATDPHEDRAYTDTKVAAEAVLRLFGDDQEAIARTDGIAAEAVLRLFGDAQEAIARTDGIAVETAAREAADVLYRAIADENIAAEAVLRLFGDDQEAIARTDGIAAHAALLNIRDLVVLDMQSDLNKAHVATGTFTTSDNLNDNDTGTQSQSDNTNEYIIIDIGKVVRLTQFRHYGSAAMNGTGRWKLQYWNILTRAWVDWVTSIAIRTSADWSTWDSSGGEIITDKLKLFATTLDTAFSRSDIFELEVKY